ncbi:MAG TPA: CARDB domain-containing protein [Herpetosiphonaceae bacterium]|nr:CARDB domain-containing protein [Herpetosiphonaceae bacterium]
MFRSLFFWRRFLLLALVLAGLAPRTATQARPATPQAGKLLAIYVLAYDNRPGSPMDLTPHYATTLHSLALATQADPLKTAVVLADLHAVGDTHIRVISNGVISTVLGLPTQAGALDPNLHEYDVADSATLGGFLRWARANYTGDVSTFTYVGHGAPLVPATDLTAIFGPAPLRRAPHATLPPLPTQIGANPDFTDQHMPPASPRPYNVLTPVGLAKALALGGAGQNPFAVIDLAMCFAASIEELTEIAPYAPYVTASPNYMFYDPRSPGVNLAAMDGLMTPRQLASALVISYDALLPPVNHPRIVVAVETEQIFPVKAAWDQTSAALYALLTDPGQRPAARQKIIDAYNASRKYDLTYCPPNDFDLASPDGLVDLRHFAAQLELQFGPNSLVGTWAGATKLRIMQSAGAMAISERAAVNGAPWFDPTPSLWQFNGPNIATLDDDAAGISMYADMVGRPISPTLTELSWHAHWYHDDNTVADNPQPYAFLADGPPGVGWDEVFQEFWDGTTTRTAACIPSIPRSRTKESLGDLAVFVRPRTLPSTVALNQPVQFSAIVTTTHEAASPLVRFKVTQEGKTMFEDSVNAGYLVTGTHRPLASAPWIPTALGAWQLEVTVDAQDVIAETNEANNQVRWAGKTVDTAASPPRITAMVANNRQFVASPAVPLIVDADPTGDAPTGLLVQMYQFVPSSSPSVRVPVLRGQQQIPASALPNVALALPESIRPGALVLHVGGKSASGWSQQPAVVNLNYAPANAALPADVNHFYRFTALRGQKIQINLDLTDGQNADLFVWEPYVVGSPPLSASAPGPDAIRLDPVRLGGEYVIVVRGDSKAVTYSLTASQNGAPLREDASAQPAQAVAPTERPRFVEPVAEQPQPSAYLPLLIR